MRGGENLTESEFQEFIITVGYRYNKKSRSAFNSFEGFRTVIEFREADKRYLFNLFAGTEKSTQLKEILDKFSSESKSFVTHCRYKHDKLRISVRMTVDSEIDRENLKKIVHFLTELFKSELIYPVCGSCLRKKDTGLYVIGTDLLPVCATCLERKRRIYIRRRDNFEKKKQSMPGGIAGSVFGAMLGSMIYIFLYQLIPQCWYASGLLAFLCYAGFVVAGQRATRKSAVISTIIAIAAFAEAEYAALIVNTAVLIESEGGGIAVGEAIAATNSGFSDNGTLMMFIFELAAGAVVILFTGAMYFLKRSLTRPLKMSKNVL